MTRSLRPAVLLFLSVGAAQAQTAPSASAPAETPQPRVFSMGQPSQLHPYAFASGGWDRGMDAASANLTAGVYRPFVNPIVGVGLALEGDVGYAGGVTGSVRALASLRSIALQVGGEVRFDDRALDLVVSALPPLRRGGPFGQGGSLRIDWLPTRGNSFRIGLQMPLGDRWAGEGRRRNVSVPLPQAPRDAPTIAAAPAATAAPLRVAAQNAFWMTAFMSAFDDNSGDDEAEALALFTRDLRAWRDSLGDASSGFPLFTQADADYHRAVDGAFAAAGAPDVADAARAALLDEVLMPYDQLLGQVKEHDNLDGLGAAAQARFAAFLADSSGLDAATQARAQGVLGALVRIAEANRAFMLAHWDGDSRLVWLPLQLGLRPEQHDEQGEINALVERAAGRDFTPGNWVLPVNNAWFYRDLVTTLHDARDYHVLWVHDIAGLDAIGRPDSVSYLVSTVGYLDALTQAVGRYDETGRIPTYLIFLDEKSYAASNSGMWLDVLEDPLRYQFEAPGHAAVEAGVAQAQDRLRAAVASSPRLQRDAAAQGHAWLRDIVRVHTNITFPSDFSFRSSDLVSWWPSFSNLLPDELMRDHRKVAFYDITERDPRRGMALLAGTGIGEQYASPTWEDRGVLTGGPAVLGLKDAARALLEGQGFTADEVPHALRRMPFPDDYAEMIRALEAEGADALAVNVHNGVGFAPKQASAAQAALYTLMPAGCVIYVPDSLWLSSFWAGQLVGASFRGCAVRVIAPALANAPSASGPVMARMRALVSRLLVVQNEMQDTFNAAGGDLRVGLYTRESDVDDLPAVLREAQAGYEAAPFLRDDVPFSDDVTALLNDFPEQLEEGGFEAPSDLVDVVDRRPKLHRKTQLIGMRAAMQQIAREMDVATIRDGLTASARLAAQPNRDADLATRVGAVYPMVERVVLLPQALRDRSVFFALVGSMNKDDRSLMLDGETLHVTAGPWSMVQYPDFVLLLGRTTWLREQSQIDRLIPPYGAVTRRLGRTVRAVL